MSTDLMKAFRIVHWRTVHENHDSRKYLRTPWYAKPNSHHGLAFRFLVKQPNRNDLYCGWCLLLDIASQGTREERGWLVRQGRALSAADLELLTGFAEGMFEDALKFFCQPQVGWLEEVLFDTTLQPETPGESPANLPGAKRKRSGAGRISRQSPGVKAKAEDVRENYPDTLHNSTLHNSTTEPTEEKGLPAALSETARKSQEEKFKESKMRWAVLNRQILELEKREEDLNAEEARSLKEKRAQKKAVEDQQARGEFP